MEDQLIKFEMLPEPVPPLQLISMDNQFPMATPVELDKSSQGIPGSRVIEVLFESEESASVIIRKVFNYWNPRSHDI